eukprot:365522-Chlamydomonas_euryale.AAC.14
MCAHAHPPRPNARRLEPGGVPGPVARLREKEVEVRVKRSFSNPPFLFAYTNPAADFDVSNNYEHGGLVEGGITKLFYQIFKDKCVPPAGGRPSLFVDVGSNFGWFSLLAASMGCRAVAFEPVPHFFAFLEYSVHANGLAHRVDMRQTVVSAEPSRPVTMTVPNRGIWGTASIGGSNIDKSVESEYSVGRAAHTVTRMHKPPFFYHSTAPLSTTPLLLFRTHSLILYPRHPTLPSSPSTHATPCFFFVPTP